MLRVCKNFLISTAIVILKLVDNLVKLFRDANLSFGLKFLVALVGVGVILSQVVPGLSVRSDQLLQVGNSLTNTVTTSVDASTGLPRTGADFELNQLGTASDFRLEIPRIGVSKEIVAEVDPRSEEIYGPVIEEAVAHGRFTRLPHEATVDGNVYLFAHREGIAPDGRDYGYFNRLDELRPGDRAEVRFRGETYTYQFRESFVIKPEDTWVYTDRASVPTLTLQTCENGEEDRLIVKFDLISVE